MAAPKEFIGVILDTETSGFGDGHVVIESARMVLPATPLEFVKAKLEDCYMDSKLYGLGEAVMSLGAMDTHGITPAKLEGLEPFKGFSYYGTYVAGHNVEFDQEVANYKGAKGICTLALSRWLWPDLDSHAQGSVLLHIGAITKRGYEWALDLTKNAHRAADDVLNCARILKMIIHIISKDPERKHHVESWEALYELSQRAQIPVTMPFGKQKDVPIEDVPQTYVDWLYAQPGKQSIYLTSAFRRAGKQVPENA